LKCVAVDDNIYDGIRQLHKFSKPMEKVSFPENGKIGFTNCVSWSDNFPRSLNILASNKSSVSIPVAVDSVMRKINCWFKFNIDAEKSGNLVIIFKTAKGLIRGISSKFKAGSNNKNIYLILPSYTEKVILLFPGHNGKLKIEDMKIFENDIESYTNDINQLKESSLQLSYFSDDYFTGNIQTDKIKFLLFSIPYDKGWHLKVDAKDTKLVKAQNGLCGTILQPGKHSVEMKFIPPYLYVGVSISTLSLLILICLSLLNMRNQKRNM
ncbi:YfhO family protein, partial [Bacteroidota bacterium]